MSVSQYGQDLYIRERFLSHVRCGFFVELGALDGLRHSNTKSFEEMGWNGICIEPHPQPYSELRRNRTCTCVQAVICSDPSSVGAFLAIDPQGPVGLIGLVEKYDPRHSVRIQQECLVAGVSAVEVTLEGKMLRDVFAEHEVTHVDFLSLDVEGSELDVLRSVDFSVTKFGVLVVENNYLEPDCEEFLFGKGYRKVERRFCDDIYVAVN